MKREDVEVLVAVDQTGDVLEVGTYPVETFFKGLAARHPDAVFPIVVEYYALSAITEKVNWAEQVQRDDKS